MPAPLPAPQYPSHTRPTPAPSRVINRFAVRGSVPQTQTIVSTEPSPALATATLRLRGAHDPGESRTQPRPRGPAIRWAEDVVDNEGMGRKSSKVCCIYHRPRAVGESSSEDDSSSSSDDEPSDGAGDSSGADDGAARPVGGTRGRGRGRGMGNKEGRRNHHQHHHRHGHDDDHGKDGAGEGSGQGRRRPSPNAYEKMPKTNVGPKASKEGNLG